jgi:phage gpG-like protein
MGGADFHVSLAGQSEIEQRLALIASRLGDLTPLMDTFGQTIETDIEDNFDGEHSPEGVSWQPSIRVIEHGGKTGQHSRMMRLSVARRVTARSVEVGTNKAYAGRFHAGFRGPEQVKSHTRTIREAFGIRLAEPREVAVRAFTRQANQVARPFVGASAAAQAEMLALAEDYVGAES